MLGVFEGFQVEVGVGEVVDEGVGFGEGEGLLRGELLNGGLGGGGGVGDQLGAVSAF